MTKSTNYLFFSLRFGPYLYFNLSTKLKPDEESISTMNNPIRFESLEIGMHFVDRDTQLPIHSEHFITTSKCNGNKLV